MRAVTDADAEHWVLTTDEGRALLAEVASVTAPGPSDVQRWRRRAEPPRVAAALRVAQGRRKGAGKFVRADRMWLDPTGVEQATAEAVARHKARRFAARPGVAVDLCCGVGGDALAMAEAGGVVAVDLDQGHARRALWNAGVYGVAGRVAAVRSRAEVFEVPAGAWVHVDPDRRAGNHRARRLADYEPGPDVLRRLTRSTAAGAVKLGPASDFDDHFGGPGYEVELVSLAGECKEATVWYGDLVTCRRRATALPGGATWTDREGPSGASAAAGPVGAWVYEPDPALSRAGLVDAFAVAHGLSRFAAGVDYLTGPDRVASPFLAAFAVIADLPLDLKRLRREVAARGLGPLEVKTRGVSHEPSAVRAGLRPSTGRPAVVLLAGGAGSARAVLARREPG